MKTEDFVGKVLTDTTGLTTTVLAWIGDELGIWKYLAAHDSETSAEVARNMGLAERPVRRAKAAYRSRIAALRAVAEEAEEAGDRARSERARDELELLEKELSRAFGLGGRARRAGVESERARVNVQRRISDAIRRISDAEPALGKHLSLAVRTGITCSYARERDPAFATEKKRAARDEG